MKWYERQRMEVYIFTKYSGDAWRKKVRKMSDAQVTAIYLRLNKAKKVLKAETFKPLLTTYHCDFCGETYMRDNPDLDVCEYCSMPFNKEIEEELDNEQDNE